VLLWSSMERIDFKALETPVKKRERKKGRQSDNRPRVKGGEASTNPHVITQDALPAPIYSVGRPSKYDAKFHPLIGRFMSIDGWTVNRMCQELGIQEGTFYAWRKLHPEFNEAVQVGRDGINKLVENALLKIALGYSEEYEEVTTTYGGISELMVNGDCSEVAGTFIETERKVTKKKQVFKPDVAAIKFWLVNRKDNDWKSDNIKVQMKHSGAVDVNSTHDLSSLSIAELQTLQKTVAKIEGKKAP